MTKLLISAGGPRSRINAIEGLVIRNYPQPTISDSFRLLVCKFAISPPASFSVLDVVRAHGIPHRRAHDFFNLLTSFGVCPATGRHRLAWIGLNAIRLSLTDACVQLDIDSRDRSVRELFAAGPSPMRGSLAKKFVPFPLHRGRHHFDADGGRAHR
jgi:hypothetical protein